MFVNLRGSQKWKAQIAREKNYNWAAVQVEIRSLDVHLLIADHLDSGPYYWVTGPMAEVAMDASHDVPEMDPDRDMPSPSGIMGFGAPLPPLP
ncbi:hypothetical protein KFL01_30330 [Kocuria flava]|nr:hypothetical protein KFL01_30330 [Kocuria flava]